MNKNISPPGPKNILPFSTLYNFRKKPIEYLTDVFHEYGNLTSFKIGFQQIIFVNDPDIIKDILVTNNSIFIKGRGLQLAKVVLGEGLLTSEHEFHKKQRKLIQPIFNHQNIGFYASIMVENTNHQIEEWQDKQVIDLGSEMMKLTLSIVCKSLFNIELDSDSKKIEETMSNIVEMFNEVTNPFYYLTRNLPLPKQKRFKQAREYLDTTILDIIEQRRGKTEDRKDLLSILMHAKDEDDNKKMTDKQVKDEVMTLFLAGHETTANLMIWTLYLLSQSPDIEKKLFAEIKEVLNGKLPEYKDIPNLTYTKKVLTESMRVYPPAWAIARKNIEEYKLNEYNFKPGCIFLISAFIMHRNPDYYDQPEKFIPERWDENTKIPKHAYIPFGSGPRTCIGEMFAWAEGILLLSTIVQKFKMKSVEGQRVELLPLITLRPKNKIMMQLEKR